jgi:TonB family protein
MPAVTLANFAVYLLHVAALVAVGAAVPRAFGLLAPRARLFHYRLVLVVALALPLVSPIALPPGSASPAWLHEIGPVATRSPLPAGTPGPSPGPFTNASLVLSLASWVGPLVLAAVVTGLVARLVWVAAGFRRLRRLRRGAARLEPRPIPVREAVALTAADADIRLSPEIAVPVNFGARRPTVLLPRTVQSYPDAEQRAVACHELIHVRRHDWLRTVGDEIVRAIFWFHPAVWWLLDEIHLAREQVVDQEVVEITGTRRPYLEALVKLARPTPSPALRPASSILGRAQLAERVTLLLKEVRMSKTRLVGGLVASISALLVAAALAVWALPLQAAPVAGGPSIDPPALRVAGAATTQQRPGAEALPRLSPAETTIVTRVEPVYPPEARAKGIRGVVIVEARIDTTGKVVNARILRSIRLLDQAALDAVRQWRFKPPAAESLAVCSVRFNPQAAESTPRLSPEQTKVLSRVRPVYSPEARAQGQKGVVIVEARIDTAGNVTDVKVLRSRGVAVDRAVIDAVRQWKFEPPAKESVAVITIPFDPEGRN